MHDNAERYLKEHLNGRNQAPLHEWKAEREKLAAEHKQINREYQQLKADITAAEKIRSNVYDIMQGEQRQNQRAKAHRKER